MVFACGESVSRSNQVQLPAKKKQDEKGEGCVSWGREGLMRSYIGGWEGRQCRIASTKVACSRLKERCAPTLFEPHSRRNGIRQTGVTVSACFATLFEVGKRRAWWWWWWWWSSVLAQAQAAFPAECAHKQTDKTLEGPGFSGEGVMNDKM